MGVGFGSRLAKGSGFKLMSDSQCQRSLWFLDLSRGGAGSAREVQGDGRDMGKVPKA